MHTQEAVTIIGCLPDGFTNNTMEPVIKMYPELNSMLNHGMYIESCRQRLIAPDRYILTFIFRYSNTEAA